MFELPMKTYSTGRKVVNWSDVVVGFKLTIDTHIINVLENKMVEKIAKISGNKRKERRLTIQLEGFEETYECGTESFKKGSFLKNLIKKSITKIVEVMSKPSNYLPAIYNPIRKNFIGETDKESMEYMGFQMAFCTDTKELHKVYKQFAKLYHPDFLGRELFPHEQIVFDYLNSNKKMLDENIRENNEWLNSLWED